MDWIGRSPVSVPVLVLGKSALLACSMFFIVKILNVDTMLYESPFTQAVGVLLYALGLSLVIISLVQLGRSAAVGIPERNTELKTHGLYRLTRNPIYGGAFTVCLGSCFFSIHLVNILLFAIAVGIHLRIVEKEEEFLEKRFGQRWLDYTRRVPRYLGIMKQSDASHISPYLALATLAIHFVSNLSGGYGYFRDEFYYIACSNHIAWGYVDHPPLSIFLLWLNRMALGDSLLALRLLPAVADAGLVYLTGFVVRELGGGRVAQFLASLAVMIAPVFLAIGGFYSMNAFESLFWIGAAYLLIKILNTGNQKLWLPFGILSGFGILNKHSMLFFGFAIVVGLVVTPERKQLASKWFWLGGTAALILFLPNLLWQATHDWATLEFMRNAQQWKIAPLSPWEFFSAQILFQHPFTLPLWLSGLLALLFQDRLKRFRLFGFAYAVLAVLFIVQRGKPYYLSPIYPVILSAGAIVLEQFINGRRWRWLLSAYGAALVLGGLILLPQWVPILPVESYIRYSELVGLRPPKMERDKDTALPQIFADRFGWKEMVAEVASVYRSLTPEEQSKTAIFAQNYGEAGAIDFFGGNYRLPRAISGHNNYWLWGTYDFSGEVVIIIGGRKEDHSKAFDSVQEAALHRNTYAMAYETDLPIFICRRPNVPLRNIWKAVKHYI